MIDLVIQSKLLTAENILSVSAGTNCPQGGDSGHGGRTILSLFDEGGTDMRVRVDGGAMIEDVRSVELLFGGDSECCSLMDALEFALSVYRQQWEAPPHRIIKVK